MGKVVFYWSHLPCVAWWLISCSFVWLPLTSEGGVINITHHQNHPPRSLSPVHLSPLIMIGFARIRSDDPCLPHSHTSWYSLASNICRSFVGSNDRYLFPSFSCPRYIVRATLDYSMVPKDEGDHLPALYALDPQHLHLTRSMVEEENYRARADKHIYQLWILFHITLHLFRKDG